MIAKPYEGQVGDDGERRCTEEKVREQLRDNDLHEGEVVQHRYVRRKIDVPAHIYPFVDYVEVDGYFLEMFVIFDFQHAGTPCDETRFTAQPLPAASPGPPSSSAPCHRPSETWKV